MNSPQNSRITKKTQTGFSLLEALVALVILSIGLLGLAGFQYKVMRNSEIARARAIVSYFSEEMIGNAATDPDNITAKYTVSEKECTENTESSFCNNWKSRLTAEVPNLANISASYVSSTGAYTITISWKIRPNDSTTHSYTSTTNLLLSKNPNTVPS